MVLDPDTFQLSVKLNLLFLDNLNKTSKTLLMTPTKKIKQCKLALLWFSWSGSRLASNGKSDLAQHQNDADPQHPFSDPKSMFTAADWKQHWYMVPCLLKRRLETCCKPLRPWSCKIIEIIMGFSSIKGHHWKPSFINPSIYILIHSSHSW